MTNYCKMFGFPDYFSFSGSPNTSIIRFYWPMKMSIYQDCMYTPILICFVQDVNVNHIKINRIKVHLHR